MNNDAVTPGYQSGFPSAFPELMSPFQFSRLLLIRWEDEGTHCYQVEENSVCVARRRDNNMINGTKLLNVAKMTRGKRDAILKNETCRVVVKSGSMILKGVWIPMERAKKLARDHKIFDSLYPLFEDDIHKIYNNTLQNRRSSFMGPNVHDHHSGYMNTNFSPLHTEPAPQFKLQRAMSDANIFHHPVNYSQHMPYQHLPHYQQSPPPLDSLDIFPSPQHRHKMSEYPFLPMPHYTSPYNNDPPSSNAYPLAHQLDSQYDLGLGLNFDALQSKSSYLASSTQQSILPSNYRS